MAGIGNWIVYKLPNGDIRIPGIFTHFCKPGCGRNHRDFVRKLKWFIAVLAGRLCVVINRGRWTKTDDGVDWIGLFTNVHCLLQIIYPIWYQKVTGQKAKPSSHVAFLDDPAAIAGGPAPDAAPLSPSRPTTC